MITKEHSPVGWALLMSELEDAKEHLSTLIEDIEVCNRPKAIIARSIFR